MEKIGKSRRQDTREWTDRDQKNKLKTKIRQLEKQLKQMRKELEREKIRNSNIEHILDEEKMQEFTKQFLNKKQKRENGKICPTEICNNELIFFSFFHPVNGETFFEKCQKCGYRKKIQQGA